MRLTFDEIRALGQRAGDASMIAGGRDTWGVEDYQASAEVKADATLEYWPLLNGSGNYFSGRGK